MKGLVSRGKRADRTGQRGGNVVLHYSRQGILAAGHEMKHKDSIDGRSVGIGRKSPKAFNDYTTAQPIIDRANRYRQDILNLERRLATHSFDFRFYSDYLGICFCNAIDASIYFHEGGSGDWLADARQLAYQLMHNTWDVDHKPRTPVVPSPRKRKCTSPNTSPNKAGKHGSHTLVKLTEIPGYKGKRQSKCGECNVDCGTACLECSTADAVVPIHRPQLTFGGGWHTFPCHAAHKARPEESAKRRPRGLGSGKPRRLVLAALQTLHRTI